MFHLVSFFLCNLVLCLLFLLFFTSVRHYVHNKITVAAVGKQQKKPYKQKRNNRFETLGNVCRAVSFSDDETARKKQAGEEKSLNAFGANWWRWAVDAATGGGRWGEILSRRLCKKVEKAFLSHSRRWCRSRVTARTVGCAV